MLTSPDLAAELATLARAACQDTSLDLGEITFFEHINLIVGSLRCAVRVQSGCRALGALWRNWRSLQYSLAHTFYVDGLGMTKDSNGRDVNIGAQQV